MPVKSWHVFVIQRKLWLFLSPVRRAHCVRINDTKQYHIILPCHKLAITTVTAMGRTGWGVGGGGCGGLNATDFRMEEKLLESRFGLAVRR